MAKILQSGKEKKNDEFYTKLTDIEKELRYYKEQFHGKVIFCNCDDPWYSNFFKYFVLQFKTLWLKKLITTHFSSAESSYKIEVQSKNIDQFIPYIKHTNIFDDTEILQHFAIPLEGNWDFRSEESLQILKQSDIIVTNPPFSLFREYMAQLTEYDKKFLIIGNDNAITYKDVFALIKANQVWMWYTRAKEFMQPDGSIKKFGNIGRWTNLDVRKRHEELVLYKHYNPEEYPKYDNYDAINVDRITDIPIDYDGAIGVPITFIDKYNPDQFEILGMTSWRDEFDAIPNKRYQNPKQINKDGSITNGSKANTRATLLLDKKPDGIYYVADNAEWYLSILYARIIIRRK